MPNHVKNIVKMQGITTLPLFTEVEDAHGSAEMKFDFNKLIPMPESLNLTSGTIENIAIETVIRKCHSLMTDPFEPKFIPSMTNKEYQGWFDRCDKTEDELCELGLQYIQNIVLYGATTWYSWSLKNWGTKWNSYENAQIDPDTIAFQTAWDAPNPILEQLSKMYPESEIEHWWADENIGYNAGYAKYYGGEAKTFMEHQAISSEAYETYIFCWGECDCLYKDEDGLWRHKNCDECDGCG